MLIAVGSKSSIKIAAVREAFALLGHEVDVTGVETVSGVNAQPVGDDEIVRGARNRAQAARAACPDSAFAIGIENGLIISPDSLADIAVVVILTRDGKERIARSAGVEFPIEFVEEARMRGFETTTAGSVLAERVGSDPADPHAALTGGRLTRKALLVQTLKGVLS